MVLSVFAKELPASNNTLFLSFFPLETETRPLQEFSTLQSMLPWLWPPHTSPAAGNAVFISTAGCWVFLIQHNEWYSVVF